VGRVLKARFPGSGWLSRYGYDDVRGQRRPGFAFLVTLAAVAGGRRLVVADLAASRGFKRETPLPGASAVAADAVDRLVTLVGETVG